MISLREQLKALANTPESASYRASDTAVGIKFQTDEMTLAFPYSHLLYAQLVSDDGLVIRFATHRVMVFGRNLTPLLDELTDQRLTLVRTLPKRLRDQASGNQPWIDRMDFTEARHKQKRPSTEDEPD